MIGCCSGFGDLLLRLITCVASVMFGWWLVVCVLDLLVLVGL